MKNTESENLKTTIDITPTWEACVRIYCAVLRNPEASQEAVISAESELLRLGKHVDNLQKNKD
jgi:hypothetical protein